MWLIGIDLSRSLPGGSVLAGEDPAGNCSSCKLHDHIGVPVIDPFSASLLGPRILWRIPPLQTRLGSVHFQ